MYNSAWSIVLLITFYGVIVNTLPYRICSQHDISTIKAKYIRQIWNEAEDLEEIIEILKEGEDEIKSKLRDFKQEVHSAIKFADDKGFNIYKCLDFNHINNIPNKVLNYYEDEIQNHSKDITLYVKRALDSIDKCTTTHLSCKSIERCCKDVVRNFDDDVIEDGIENLEYFSEKLVKKLKKDINKEIDAVWETTNLCYLEYLQSTTVPVPESTTASVPEKPTTIIPSTTAESLPVSTTVTVPETSTIVPSTTAESVPVSSTVRVPETSTIIPSTTTESVPVSTTVTVPKTSTIVPNTTAESVPVSTTVTVPETSTIVPSTTAESVPVSTTVRVPETSTIIPSTTAESAPVSTTAKVPETSTTIGSSISAESVPVSISTNVP